MTFTTVTFLLFLPVVFGLYWMSGRLRWRNAVIVAASYFFYGWWDPRFALLMLAASLVDFGAGIALDSTSNPRLRRSILLGSCLFSLGLLGYFKYAGFFISNVIALAAAVGIRLTPVEIHTVLPVGISFYTFQTLSYVIDVYRRRLPASRNVIEYMAYVAFFPQLVAGPIERASHLLPQFQSLRRFDRGAAADGLRLMAWGFFKKMAIADNLGALTDAAYKNVQVSDGPTLLLATLAFAFQIYCDFSAYSDIAAGTARLFGVELVRNFALPYFSQSVAEFWRRWHISLSSWFWDYIYVPLGGSRVSLPRRMGNVMATFVLSGLWHGASWNFIVWGALNGVAVLPSVLWPPARKLGADDQPGGPGILPRPGVLVRMLATFVFACATWVFFRARSVGDASLVFSRLWAGPWSASAMAIAWSPSYFLLGLCGFLLAAEWSTRNLRHPLAWPRLPRPWRWVGYSLLLWATLYLAPEQRGLFIYFQF
jgi:alginate O-acetyltransferase complex protein AlgI